MVNITKEWDSLPLECYFTLNGDYYIEVTVILVYKREVNLIKSKGKVQESHRDNKKMKPEVDKKCKIKRC